MCEGDHRTRKDVGAPVTIVTDAYENHPIVLLNTDHS